MKIEHMSSVGIADVIVCRVISPVFWWVVAFRTVRVLYLECVFNYDKNVNPCAQTGIKNSQ